MDAQRLRAIVPYAAQRCLKSVKHNADRRISYKYGLDIPKGGPALFDYSRHQYARSNTVNQPNVVDLPLYGFGI